MRDAASHGRRTPLLATALLVVLGSLPGAVAQGYTFATLAFTPAAFTNSAAYSWSRATSTDATGSFYMFSMSSKMVVKVSSAGNVTVLADETVLSSPSSIVADSNGTVYVYDGMTSPPLCMIPAGTTGSCVAVPGYTSSMGSSYFSSDASGNVYVGDGSFASIAVTRLRSGTATSLSFSPALSGAWFASAWDTAGNMYATAGNNIMKYTPVSGNTTSYTGTVLAGSGLARFADGTGTAASFNSPSGLAVDSSFNVIVADSSNNRLRKVTPAGVVTTIAGCGTTSTAAACTATSVMGVTPLATAMFLSISNGVFLFGNSPALLSGGNVQYMIVAPSPPPPSPPFAPSGTNVAVTYRLFGYSVYTFAGNTMFMRFTYGITASTATPGAFSGPLTVTNVSFANVTGAVDVSVCCTYTYTYSASPSPTMMPTAYTLSQAQAGFAALPTTSGIVAAFKTNMSASGTISALPSLTNITVVQEPTIVPGATTTFSGAVTELSAILTIGGWTPTQFAAVAPQFPWVVAAYLGQANESVVIVSYGDVNVTRRKLHAAGVGVTFKVLVLSTANTLNNAAVAGVNTALTAMPSSSTFSSRLAAAAAAASVPASTSLSISAVSSATLSSGLPPTNAYTPSDAGGGEAKKTTTSTIIGAVVGVLGLGPGTAFTIAAFFYKKPLRTWLLKRKLRWLADLVVPDLEGDVALLEVKMAELEKFMSKQKLPRLQDCTPELDAADVELELGKALGTGGYGAVYTGRIKSRDQAVAVKALFGTTGGESGKPTSVPEDVRKKMKREATIMCSLNHPHVLHVFGVVPDRGWIIMELCAGGSLSTLLCDPEEMVSPEEQLRFATEMATGIAYLHMSDVAIVHGDMKADNVLLTSPPERSVRICDFGMSEAKDRSKSMTAVLGTSAGAGVTVQWTAPELLKGEAKTFASDVFAMGVTLWEIFERATPFGSMPEMVVINQLLAGQRPTITDKIPPQMLDIIRACWAQDAEKRPKAAQVAYLLSAMKRFGAGETKTISRSILTGGDAPAEAAAEVTKPADKSAPDGAPEASAQKRTP